MKEDQGAHSPGGDLSIEPAEGVSERLLSSVYEEFGATMLRFIQRRVPVQADAEDILQDVFVRIHSTKAVPRSQEHVQAWVYQIVRNCIADYYRHQRDEPVVYEEHNDASYELEGDDEVLSCLRSMADQLPDMYRQAIVLVEFEGMPQKDLAKALGLSASGAKSRVQRARQKLRMALFGCCEFHIDSRGHAFSYTPKKQNCPCP